MHCNVLSHVGHGSIGSFDSMSIEWFVEGMFNGEGGVQCIKEFCCNACKTFNILLPEFKHLNL